jgi:hypothetical protein
VRKEHGNTAENCGRKRGKIVSHSPHKPHKPHKPHTNPQIHRTILLPGKTFAYSINSTNPDQDLSPIGLTAKRTKSKSQIDPIALFFPFTTHRSPLTSLVGRPLTRRSPPKISTQEFSLFPFVTENHRKKPDAKSQVPKKIIIRKIISLRSFFSWPSKKVISQILAVRLTLLPRRLSLFSSSLRERIRLLFFPPNNSVQKNYSSTTIYTFTLAFSATCRNLPFPPFRIIKALVILI